VAALLQRAGPLVVARRGVMRPPRWRCGAKESAAKGPPVLSSTGVVTYARVVPHRSISVPSERRPRGWRGIDRGGRLFGYACRVGPRSAASSVWTETSGGAAPRDPDRAAGTSKPSRGAQSGRRPRATVVVKSCQHVVGSSSAGCLAEVRRHRDGCGPLRRPAVIPAGDAGRPAAPWVAGSRGL
jgi:hypothetical protein